MELKNILVTWIFFIIFWYNYSKYLSPVIADRFTAIHDEITEWQKKDPNLSDLEGFLEYIKTRDIGQFNVGDTRRWMKNYQEARKQGVSVTEFLFETRRKMVDKDLTYRRASASKHDQRVFVIDEEKRQELEEIDERLKSLDPARIKRKNK